MPKPPSTVVAHFQIDKIRLDGGTQSRAQLNADTIDHYAELYLSKAGMPAIVVFYDGEHYWLADGFHRVHGAKKAGRSKLSAEVRQGSVRDAILYSASANNNHGLPPNGKDKRFNVARFLGDDEWANKSDRWIAEKCGVGNQLVGDVRKELCDSHSSTAKRIGKDGKTRKLPKREPKKPSPTASPTAEKPGRSRLALVDQPDDDGVEEKDDQPDESERDPDTALIELDADVDRHMKAWEWPAPRFVAALEGWARRARVHFEREERLKANG